VFVLIAVVCGAFLFAGANSMASSSRAVLHGLCAQRPSHTFHVGTQLLPFDARMTGIYIGAFCCWTYLVCRRRTLAGGTPPLPVIAVLATGLAALAFDGFNSLMLDLGWSHLYEPQNAVRFFTGYGTGMAIASLEVWLIGGSLWRLSSREPAWKDTAEVGRVALFSVLAYGAIVLAPSWVYPVIASVLMLSAWITLTALVIVITVSSFRLEFRIVRISDLQMPLVASAIGALIMMLGLAQGRFWLERTLGIPQDFVAMADAGVIAILLLV
jgi:uncharacterized membrane protein